jgi:transcriptional repressor NrdR
MLPQVCKKDGRREPFDRMKIINGIVKACEKRPISKTDIEMVVDRLETRLQESTDREISTTTIGEWVMKELHGMDEVAYVRFASVYRSFRDISEFMQELQELLKK